MRVFITGGAGFIGSHLAESLAAAGHDVLVMDNLATGAERNLTTSKNVRLEIGTVADGTLVSKLVSGFKPECIVHAAASYKDPHNWVEDIQTNGIGTVNVIHAARAVGAKRFIYFQTALCYGLQPLEQPITLRHPIHPEGSSYAYSKTLGEQYLLLSGLDFVVFRLANIYGPRNISGPLPLFYQRLTQNKSCFVTDTRRDFVFVDDLIQVVLKAVLEGTGSGAYHISSGRDFAIKEVFDAVVGALHMPTDTPVEIRPRNPDDVFSILLDPTRTNRDFTWKTSTPLSIGVAKAIEWYKAFGISHAYTHLNIEEKVPR